MKPSRRERQHRGALTPSAGGPAPVPELNRLRREIDRLLEEPFGSLAPSTSFFEGWNPIVDIFEDKDKYTVKAELPGMNKEDIEVSLDGNTLTITGERKEEQEQKERESCRAERFFGRFQRSLTLPAEVQADKIQATYKNGVLSITLPKAETAKARQISIQE